MVAFSEWKKLYLKKTGMTEEQAEEWLNSPEHKFYIIGGKEGLGTGFVLGLILAIPIGTLLATLILK